jgi:hypothetical protein
LATLEQMAAELTSRSRIGERVFEALLVKPDRYVGGAGLGRETGLYRLHTGSRERVEELDLGRHRYRSRVYLETFKRSFLGDLDRFRKDAHRSLPRTPIENGVRLSSGLADPLRRQGLKLREFIRPNKYIFNIEAIWFRDAKPCVSTFDAADVRREHEDLLWALERRA